MDEDCSDVVLRVMEACLLARGESQESASVMAAANLEAGMAVFAAAVAEAQRTRRQMHGDHFVALQEWATNL